MKFSYKLLFVLMLFAGLFCGCGQAKTVEYVTDTLEEPVLAEPGEIFVELPGEAAIPTMEEGSSRYYLCKDYEIAIDTRPGGDLRDTVETLTGYPPEALTVVETDQPGAKRYDFVWAAAGENGDRLGRGVILDDGNYHYTMTVLRDASNTESLQVVWRQVFSSFRLV